MKGIYKEVQKVLGSSVDNYILSARIAQGLEELVLTSKDEKEMVVDRWLSMNISPSSENVAE